MRPKTSSLPDRYHWATSVTHWVMVALLAWLIWGGRALGGLIERGFDFDFVIAAYSQHKAVGLVVFFLALVRLILRWVFPAPPHEAGVRGLAALWVQRGLYVLLFIYPLTGYAYHSATVGFKTPVTWGPLTFPDLPIGGEALWHQAHQGCLYLLGLLLALHLGGALYHLLIARDGMFRRIVPF